MYSWMRMSLKVSMTQVNSLMRMNLKVSKTQKSSLGAAEDVLLHTKDTIPVLLLSKM
jgi:hypothetical protein